VYLKHVHPASEARSKEPGILKGRGDRRPLRPVWRQRTVLTLKTSLRGNARFQPVWAASPPPYQGEEQNGTPMKRHGRNASKPQSKMALSERFETKGSKPEAKAPPKRRHFAVENRCT